MAFANFGSSAVPIFSDWIFTGNLELTEPMKKSIVDELPTLNKKETEFGWVTGSNHRGEAGLNLVKLLGTAFKDNVEEMFFTTMPADQKAALSKRLSCLNSTFICLHPNFYTADNYVKNRWYTCICAVHADTTINITLRNNNAKFYLVSEVLENNEHHVQLKSLEYIFFPSHIPFKINANKDSTNQYFLHMGFGFEPSK